MSLSCKAVGHSINIYLNKMEIAHTGKRANMGFKLGEANTPVKTTILAGHFYPIL